MEAEKQENPSVMSEYLYKQREKYSVAIYANKQGAFSISSRSPPVFDQMT